MLAIKPILTEYDLGPAGWRKLHALARQRDRHPRDEVRHLVLFALDRALAGEDVELSDRVLDDLLQTGDLETVA